MKRPFLSIVTISYNQATYLQKCLDSVVSQKRDDVEYIVADPGSTDGSREILKSYEGIIDHLLLEKDKGPADGLNKCFARASGEVGYFINSDDFMLPEAVNRMRDLWREAAEMDVLLGGAWMVDGAGDPMRELRADPMSLASLVDGGVSIVQQGMSFRMNAFRKHGGFNASNRTCWDYELLCNLFKGGAQAKVTRERFGAFRLYDQSLSGGSAGADHGKRYHEDLARIRMEMTGQPTECQRASPTFLRKTARLLNQPMNSIAVAGDICFPWIMQRRWQNDLNRSRGDNPA